jgi:hypothetical protein
MLVDGRLGEAGRGAVHEVCKYVVKPQNLMEERPDGSYYANPDVVEVMHDALKGPRLLGFGGCLAAARKELKQADVLGKPLRILGHAELYEPVRNLLHDSPIRRRSHCGLTELLHQGDSIDSLSDMFPA